MNKSEMRVRLAEMIDAMDFKMQTTDMLDKKSAAYQSALDELETLGQEILLYAKRIDGTDSMIAEIRYAGKGKHFYMTYFEHFLRLLSKLSDRE